MKLSQRITNIKPSAAVDLDRILTKMVEDGEQIISFNAGQPDFKTPDNIVSACKEALDQGKTKYTSINGILELRKAVCNKLKRENNISYNPDEVVITTGAKQALYNTIQVLVDKGDEVIIPTPCWVSYTEMVKLAQGTPVFVETKKDYHLDIQAIKKAITPSTKSVIINTPCNPTGAVYTKDELQALGDLAVENDFFVISDEVYEKLVYDDNTHISIASLSEEIKKHCITINGFSKAFSMTGWRIGYLASSKEIALAVCSLQSHTTSNSTTFVQWAAIEALNGSQDSVVIMRDEFKKRRDYVCSVLSGIKGVKLEKPQGSFYVFPDISELFGKRTPNGEVINNVTDFCSYVLRDYKVAILPGTAFENPNCFRLAYANSMENLKIGLEKIFSSIIFLK